MVSRLGIYPNTGVKLPVVAVTTVNITLAGAQTIGTVSVVNADRVLVAAQTDPLENGIYDVGTAWTRAKDFNQLEDVDLGCIVLDLELGSFWQSSFTGDWTPDTTAITFSEVVANTTGVILTSGGQTIAGALTLTGLLTGAAATFTGTLTGVAGVFSGAISATTATFTGTLTGVAATFSGLLTGTTATFSGLLTGAAATFSGTLTGVAAVLSGAISATTATFTGTLTGVAGVFSGAISATTATFTGLLTGAAATFSGAIASTLAIGTAPFTITSTTEVANLNVEQHSGVKIKIVEIGDWDMDATDTTNKLHGIANYKNIRTVQVMIRDDNDINYKLLDMVVSAATASAQQGGIDDIESTTIKLHRLAGGLFDGILYDSTTYNRGWITIHYV